MLIALCRALILVNDLELSTTFAFLVLRLKQCPAEIPGSALRALSLWHGVMTSLMT